MTVLVDQCLSHKIAVALVACDWDARAMSSEYGQDCPDTVWLPQVGKRGWVVLTGDKMIRKRPEERRAFEQHGVIGVFVPNAIPGQTPLARMAWVLQALAKVERVLERAKRGTMLLIGSRHSVSQWSSDAAAWVKAR